MDEVDAQQQRELDANRRRDDAQQIEIERLAWMQNLLLIINTAAAFAQIMECYRIWTRGGP